MKVFNFNRSQFLPVTIYNAGFEYCDSLHSYGPATRRYTLIHYVVSGKGRFECRSGSYGISPGQCFIIHPEELTYYQADKDEPWHYIWVGFNTRFHLPECIGSGVLEAEFLRHTFLDIEQNYDILKNERSDGMREAYLCGKVVEMLTLMEINYSSETKTKAELIAETAKNYIDDNFEKNITVSSIAEIFHHNRTYFSRMFKEATGVSPQQYIVNKRLHEASILMTKHGFTPSRAAATVGYDDLYLFSKMFKKKYGVSPRAYAYAKKNT